MTAPQTFEQWYTAQCPGSVAPNDAHMAWQARQPEIDALRAERDAAFRTSKCECESNEACANLAKLHARVSELERIITHCGPVMWSAILWLQGDHYRAGNEQERATWDAQMGQLIHAHKLIGKAMKDQQ